MVLDREIATYERELPRLADRFGKYALVYQDEPVTVWDTFADALQAGYGRFGLRPFLVQRIGDPGTPDHVTGGVKYVCRS
jgi:hypothetical protein